ncbi:MAG: hypothetical protein DI539_25475 [Flavobacterium psychrophilum]|nr:MAG: hypothetical protein DI539_25475 [Flavobacterium psychrophilum]
MSNKTYDLIFNSDSGSILNDDINFYYLEENSETSISYFPNFNRINIIVGSNNSGKSRFMRYLMSLKLFYGVHDLDEVNNQIKEYNSLVELVNSQIDAASNRLNNRPYHTLVNGRDQQREFVEKLQKNRLGLLDGGKLLSLYSVVKSNNNKFAGLEDINVDEKIIDYKKINENTTRIYNEKIKRYYIPTLRTAHSLFNDSKKIENDVYLDTLNEYYKLNEIDVEVFTGLHLYKNVLNTRNSIKAVRKSFENFENFISKNFFGGKQVDIVAKFDKDKNSSGVNNSEVISIHIDGEKDSRDLSQLGDGIQAILILMYKIFTAEDTGIIFIDEPELNLHPGMQRLFLEQIYSNQDLTKKNLTYIISTHSNHFLDLTLEKKDVSIYTFTQKNQNEESKEKEFVIRNVNRGDNTILKHLGVNNSSVFLANCSLWVEGVSDRNYIKAFLKSYLKYIVKNEKDKYKCLKEDIDYVFFEYAGSNIAHYMFEEDISESEEERVRNEINALALSNKIFLLADSDNVDGRTKKGKRLKELEENKKPNFIPKIIREVREIENLLTNEVWEEVLIKFCNKNLVDNHKSEILIKISDALTKHNSSEYKKDYIGVFLNKIDAELKEINNARVLNKIYEVKTDGSYGTFIQKSELSQYVLEADIEWEVYAKSKEIEILTEEVYHFIIDSMN